MLPSSGETVSTPISSGPKRWIMNETATLAKYAANLRYGDIPQEALDRARNTICDTVGAIFSGLDCHGAG